ncbi:DegQ family serine endoprotease [candidate division KSB1 bacterium]|nr:DegQ family serine endoprotease [candidate division KSB1 bacterium]
MAISKRNALLLVSAIFVGIVVGLIISTNFDLILNSVASDNNKYDTKNSTLSETEEYVETSALSETSAESSAGDISGLLELEQAYINVSKNVKPWVVTITSEKYIKYRQFDPFDFFGDFFGKRDRGRNNEDKERTYVQQGLGSGVIVSADGYILTNNHVVQEADEIRVITMDKKEYKAELIGKDDKTDVAVVRIKDKNLPFAKLGNSDKIQVGQIVLAVGNPFSQELQLTVTNGIISAKGRSGIGTGTFYQDFIQTTAAINPGNSGGALVNLKGELIGINTAIISRSGGFNGIGFAIPINMAKHVMGMLMDHGYVVRGYLGVVPQPLTEEMAQGLGIEDAHGAFISTVADGTPADKAGLKEEDVVVAIDGKRVEDVTEFRWRIAEYEPGSKVKLKVFRDGRFMNITVNLEKHPDDRPQKEVAEKESNKLGITVSNLSRERARKYGYEDEQGVVVTDVEGASQAYRNGIREGDLITAINRKEVESVRDYNRIVDKAKAGDILLIRLKKRSRESLSNWYVSLRVPE